MPELQTRASDAVQLALDSGADGAWASASRTRKVEFQARDGSLEKVQEDTSASVSVQLYVDGRYSTHSTTSLKPERLGAFVKEAVEMTRALAPDPDRALPDAALFAGRSDADLQIADGTVDTITREQRMAWLDGLDAGARTHEAVISATSYVSDDHTRGAAASSNGFEGTWEGTSVWVGAEVTVREEGERRPEGGHWLGVRNVADLPTMSDVGAAALNKAVARLGSTQGPTERTTLIVDPQVGGRLFWSLLRPAHIRMIHQGRSFYADQVGEQVVSDALTVTDEPLLPRGLASRHFAGEGSAARPMPIFEAGVLRNLYADTYYSRKAEFAPTTGGPSNLVLAPSVDKDFAGLLQDIGEGIYLTSWLGGNSDSTTGDFSFGLRGHHVHKGQIGAPIGEMNVTGNLLDLFGSLVAVGNDPWTYRRFRTPTMVFEGVQFSGA